MTPRQAREWADAAPMLVFIVSRLVEIWPEAEPVEVMCIFRTATEDAELGGSGIHAVGPPYRACDLRIRTLGPDSTMTENDQIAADKMANVVNREFQYDPTRPEKKCVVSKPHGSGPHIHSQVHPRTVRIPGHPATPIVVP